MPALSSYVMEPIWQQFRALLPERETNHPLGCHRPRLCDRTVFEKLVQVLGSVVLTRGSLTTSGVLRPRCGGGATSGYRPARWMPPEEMALELYDQIIGLELSEMAVDYCITKARVEAEGGLEEPGG